MYQFGTTCDIWYVIALFGLANKIVITTLLGILASAMAAPIGFGSMINVRNNGLPEPSYTLDLGRIAPDYDYARSSIQDPLFEIADDEAEGFRVLSVDPWPQGKVSVPEPPPEVIVLAGLTFFGMSGLLRMLPGVLTRFRKDRRRSRRRRVKVEMRMMA